MTERLRLTGRTVPVQLLFSTPTDDGVLVDGLVVGPSPGALPLAAGEPFSILMETGARPSEDEAATQLLRRWSEDSSVVDARTDALGQLLVLSSGDEELLLVIS